ncbi:hypothetical protein IWQ60_007108 [Tieghemiomyces parasiticus]|uniref:Arf-GAP domain-containing protein n=1 Tax=Tieghemiomyces parasiticus TaxID=78921 RepID=A0A9W8A4B7_9FUNG|nr:hypothetical protein IWQ60_007108 [Tieghemiomyces parasiticus]
MSRKLNDKHVRILRDLLKLHENRYCFDCGSTLPSYANLFNHTFVCEKCSGIHRELSHRVKSISASTFTPVEIRALVDGGNAKATRVWLAKWTAKDYPLPANGDLDLVKEFIRQKYVRRRWVDESMLAASNQARTESSAPPTLATKPLPLAPPSSHGRLSSESRTSRDSALSGVDDRTPAHTLQRAPTLARPTGRSGGPSLNRVRSMPSLKDNKPPAPAQPSPQVPMVTVTRTLGRAQVTMQQPLLTPTTAPPQAAPATSAPAPPQSPVAYNPFTAIVSQPQSPESALASFAPTSMARASTVGTTSYSATPYQAMSATLPVPLVPTSNATTGHPTPTTAVAFTQAKRPSLADYLSSMHLSPAAANGSQAQPSPTVQNLPVVQPLVTNGVHNTNPFAAFTQASAPPVPASAPAMDPWLAFATRTVNEQTSPAQPHQPHAQPLASPVTMSSVSANPFHAMMPARTASPHTTQTTNNLGAYQIAADPTKPGPPLAPSPQIAPAYPTAPKPHFFNAPPTPSSPGIFLRTDGSTPHGGVASYYSQASHPSLQTSVAQQLPAGSALFTNPYPSPMQSFPPSQPQRTLPSTPLTPNDPFASLNPFSSNRQQQQQLLQPAQTFGPQNTIPLGGAHHQRSQTQPTTFPVNFTTTQGNLMGAAHDYHPQPSGIAMAPNNAADHQHQPIGMFRMASN